MLCSRIAQGLNVPPVGKEPALARLGVGGGCNVYASSQDTADSPTRRRAQTWRHLFVTPCASL